MQLVWLACLGFWTCSEARGGAIVLAGMLASQHPSFSYPMQHPCAPTLANSSRQRRDDATLEHAVRLGDGGVQDDIDAWFPLGTHCMHLAHTPAGGGTAKSVDALLFWLQAVYLPVGVAVPLNPGRAQGSITAWLQHTLSSKPENTAWYAA